MRPAASGFSAHSRLNGTVVTVKQVERRLTDSFSAVSSDSAPKDYLHQLLKRRARMRQFLVPVVTAVSAPVAPGSPSAHGLRRPTITSVRTITGASTITGSQANRFSRVERIFRTPRDRSSSHSVMDRGAFVENQAANLQDRIWRASRNGVQPGEARQFGDRH